MGTASPVEIAWTGVMLFGLVTALSNFLYARQRLIELHDSGKNGLLEVARKGAMSDQLKLAGAFACLAAVGIMAMAMPQTRQLTLADWLAASPFFLAGFLLVWQSVGVRRRPSQSRQEFNKEEAKKRKLP